MQVSDQQKFLRSGLSKLAEAEETVDSLSQGADKQRALLKVKQAEAEQALGYIQESMMKASVCAVVVVVSWWWWVSLTGVHEIGGGGG